MADKDLAERLYLMHACPEAVEWARGYTDDAVAWRECQRGDWMLWLLGRLNVDRKRLVLAACECARLSLHLVSADEERPHIAIKTAEAWARDEGPTLDDVRRSAYATYAAYAAAAYDDATYATYAAYAATYAAYAAAHAITADAATYAASLSQCADIARTHFPEVPHVQ